MNLRGPRIVRRGDLLALRRVVDRCVEIGLQLGEQRVRIVEIDRDGVLAFDLHALRLVEAQGRQIEGADRLQSELAVPGPLHVFGGELVAPVALHALAQLEADELAGGIELERLGELALHGEAGRHVRMIGDILAEGAGYLRIGDLLEFEQIVVERGDRLEGAEADVEVAVEALRRRGRGDDQRAARRRRRLRRQSARQRRAAGECRSALEHLAAAK